MAMDRLSKLTFHVGGIRLCGWPDGPDILYLLVVHMSDEGTAASSAAMLVQAFTAIEIGQSPQIWLAALDK